MRYARCIVLEVIDLYDASKINFNYRIRLLIYRENPHKRGRERESFFSISDAGGLER